MNGEFGIRNSKFEIRNCLLNPIGTYLLWKCKQSWLSNSIKIPNQVLQSFYFCWRNLMQPQWVSTFNKVASWCYQNSFTVLLQFDEKCWNQNFGYLFQYSRNTQWSEFLYCITTVWWEMCKPKLWKYRLKWIKHKKLKYEFIKSLTPLWQYISISKPLMQWFWLCTALPEAGNQKSNLFLRKK